MSNKRYPEEFKIEVEGTDWLQKTTSGKRQGSYCYSERASATVLSTCP